MIEKMSAQTDETIDQFAQMVAVSLLPKAISAQTLRLTASGFRKYSEHAAAVDWTKYYTCMRPFEQQFLMVKFIPEEWLRGLPDFLKMVFSDYLELRGDPSPAPKELIQGWFNEFFQTERTIGGRRVAG